MKTESKPKAILGWNLLALGILIFGAGCATTANYDYRVQSWKGKDAPLLVKAWGKPDSTEPLSNGNQMYVYARLHRDPVAYAGSQRTLASAETPSQSKEKPKTVYIKCATYFEVNPQGKVVSTLFRGNDCKARD